MFGIFAALLRLLVFLFLLNCTLIIVYYYGMNKSVEGIRREYWEEEHDFYERDYLGDRTETKTEYHFFEPDVIYKTRVKAYKKKRTKIAFANYEYEVDGKQYIKKCFDDGSATIMFYKDDPDKVVTFNSAFIWFFDVFRYAMIAAAAGMVMAVLSPGISLIGYIFFKGFGLYILLLIAEYLYLTKQK